MNGKACEGPGHRGEERFKHAEEGWVAGWEGGSYRWSLSWKWDRMGRSILEHIGLSLKYVSPAVPAVFYSRCLLVVPACVQDNMVAVGGTEKCSSF